MKPFPPLLILTVLLCLAMSSTEAKDPLEAYPSAEEGMTRFVLRLPKEKNESLFKVEIIVGKTVNIDASNRYFFGGEIKRETVAGWGYSYHILRKLGAMAGTLMAVPPGTPKVDRFIPVGGQPLLAPYNSKLPLVVYVPEGVEVKYRLWRADEAATFMKRGD